MTKSAQAIQDQIAGNHCFGCGPDNAGGLQIKSYWQDDGTTICRFEPRNHLCAGPAEVLNGGIVATLIDCHCVCTAMAHAYVTAGREIGTAPQIWFATGSLDIDYKSPAPIDRLVELVAEVTESTDRKTVVKCRLSSGDEICAQGEVVAVRVPDEWHKP